MNSFILEKDFSKGIEWSSLINAKSKSFKEYIRHQIGDKNYALLEEFSKEVDVFIFSGMIRDYLLETSRSSRDIDFTYRGHLRKKWKKIAIENFNVIENRFGGFKLIGRESIDCDVWNIENTYGIDHKRREPRPNDLLESVFFNFTSIVYDFKSEKFIYDTKFLDFLKSRKIEIVNENNPDTELCFVNIYHNFKQFGFQPGISVMEWAKNNFEEYLWFGNVQHRHFHTQLYSQIELLNFISVRLLK